MKVLETSKAYTHITLDEAKEQARVSKNFTADDTQLNALMTVATDMAENYIENHIALTSLQANQKEFSGQEISIKEGHLKELTDIRYTDPSGAAIVLSAGAGYSVEAEEFSFKIVLDQPIQAKDLKVNFICGFDAVTIKPVLKQAILIKLVDLYDVERSSYNSGTYQLNTAFVNLLNYHKRLNIF